MNDAFAILDRNSQEKWEAFVLIFDELLIANDLGMIMRTLCKGPQQLCTWMSTNKSYHLAQLLPNAVTFVRSYVVLFHRLVQSASALLITSESSQFVLLGVRNKKGRRWGNDKFRVFYQTNNQVRDCSKRVEINQVLKPGLFIEFRKEEFSWGVNLFDKSRQICHRKHHFGSISN